MKGKMRKAVSGFLALVTALGMVLSPVAGNLTVVQAGETAQDERTSENLFTGWGEGLEGWTCENGTAAYQDGGVTLTAGDTAADVAFYQGVTLEKDAKYTLTAKVVTGAGLWVNGYWNVKLQNNSINAGEADTLTIPVIGKGEEEKFGVSIWLDAGATATITSLTLTKDPVDDGNQGETPDGYYIDVYEEDYSSAAETGWNSTWADGGAKLTDTVGEGCWKTWSETENALTATRKFSGLAAGSYRFSLAASGDATGTVVITDGTNPVQSGITITGWNEGGIYPQTNVEYELAQAGEVTVTMNYTFTAGAWCNIDDMKLSRKVTEAEKKAYELEQLHTRIDSCSDLNQGDYTADSWNKLADAIAAAKALTDASTIEEIESANTAIKRAKNALALAGIFVKKVDGLSEDFIRGVDISSYISEKDSGAAFKDESGKELSDVEFFTLLKDSGINYVRVRVWNDPYLSTDRTLGYGGGNNDLEKAVRIGKLATDAGMKVLIDFHYSDFWADPERQYVPKAWKDMSIETKENALYTYTKESMETLLNAGVDVGMVQVGNETNNGVAGETDKKDMCTLFNAGSRAIREVAAATSKEILVAVHYTDPQTPGKYAEITGYLADNNVDYDVFATSYYPNIHGSMSNLTAVLDKVVETYGKKVMVAETAWAWTTKDGDGHSSDFNPGSNADYSISVQGQATVVRDVVEAVHNIKNQAGIGVFYWEPAWIPVQYAYDEDGKLIGSVQKSNQENWEKYGSGWASSYSNEYDPDHGGKYYGGSVKDNEAFFDFEGKPLPSLTVFKDIYTGRTGSVIKLEVIKNGEVTVKFESSDVTTEYAAIKQQLPATVTAIFNDSERVPMDVVWNFDNECTKITDFGNYEISGSASCTYKGVTYSGTTVCDVVVLPNSILADGDFEEQNTGNAWAVSNADGVEIKWNDTPLRGEGAMHFWCGSDMDFTLTQTVTAQKAGMYCATMELQGGDGGSSDDISVTLTNLTSNQSAKGNAVLAGWGDWQKAATDSVAVNAGDKILVTVRVKAAAGAWGSIDDVFLYKVGEYTASGSSGSGSSGSGSSGSSSSGSGSTSSDGNTGSGDTTTKPDKPSTDDSQDNTSSGSATTEVTTETTTNKQGNTVHATITTDKDADGKVTGVTEVSEIKGKGDKTIATVSVKKDAAGKVTEAEADVFQSGKIIAASTIAQIVDAAGTKSVDVTVAVTNAAGKTKYTVTVDSANLKAGRKLKVVAVDKKTGKYVIVNAKTYTVSERGNVKVALQDGKDYALLTAKEAAAVEKAVLKTVTVKSASATVKKGKKTSVKLSSKLNMDNVKSVSYASSKKSVATVSKSGKVTAKKAGNAVIKVKVTLNNGKTKTVTMKIKVK